MGKKGSWFSAIKKVFTHNSKDKPTDEPNKKSSKEKKKGKGILRHGETKSLVPLFREPSSIAKILGEADQLLIRPTTPSEQPKTPLALPVRPISPRAASPKAASYRASSAQPISPRGASPKAASSRASSPQPVSPRAVSQEVAPPEILPSGTSSSKATPPSKVEQSRKEISNIRRPEPTLRNHHLSATKIQAVFRGYLARQRFQALRGLMRLQEVVRGQNVKRQTTNAMKQMQLLVRIQRQIQSRRIQMLENQAIEHQAYKNNKEVESTLSKWTHKMSENGENDDWDDSLLPREEVERRLRKKVEAVMKRERAMAYAFSHQLWKSNPKSAQTPSNIRSNGYPWWWNWLERQLSHSQSATKNVALNPSRPISEYKASPRLPPSNYRHSNFTINDHESVTPHSSRSVNPVRAKPFHTPSRTPPTSSSNNKPRTSAAYDSAPLKDDDSLVSCPPFSVPNYMVATASAKAKARANSNPRERFPGTPGSNSSRRFSFPLTPNTGSFKWNGVSNRDPAS